MTTKTVIDTKTFYDVSSLIEVLEELRDSREDGGEMSVWMDGKCLTNAKVKSGEGSDWVELR